MDHAEVRELLELAAAEPGGIDALLSGGSAEARRIEDHLAACDVCRAELDELRASVAAIRDVIRTTPTPELRDRTLALVTSAGRARTAELTPGPMAGPAARPRFSWRSLVPAASLGAAAVAVLALVLVWRTVDTRLATADARIAEQQSAIAGLTVVTDWTLRLGTAQDAQLIRLASPSGADREAGTVLVSAERGELVMIATGLPAPPDGYEYRCWIDQGSGPVRIGRMYHTGAVAYWGGAVARLRGISGPFTLGVSLVSERSTATGQPVLVGSQ
jgi:hypothetical protein